MRKMEVVLRIKSLLEVGVLLVMQSFEVSFGVVGFEILGFGFDGWGGRERRRMAMRE